MPGPRKKAPSQEDDPHVNPTPGGSKRPPDPPSQSSEHSDEDDPSKTPKKKAKRATSTATTRNKPLWDHFELDPSVPKKDQNKNTKVCTL